MPLVIDASTVVAALVDGGPDGRWAEAMIARGSLAAPHLMPAEVASVLRRAATSGRITPDIAVLAHSDVPALRVELFPYAPLAERVWALRSNLTPYDAWYVALAESLEAELATLDERLARAPGLRCAVVHPPGR